MSRVLLFSLTLTCGFAAGHLWFTPVPESEPFVAECAFGYLLLSGASLALLWANADARFNLGFDLAVLSWLNVHLGVQYGSERRNNIRRQLEMRDYRFSALIEAIVDSVPFKMRRAPQA